MFSWVGAKFDDILGAYVLDVVTALIAAITPLALAAMTAWVALYGWAVLRNEVPETLPTFVWKVFKIGLVLAFALQAGFYIGNVADTADALRYLGQHYKLVILSNVDGVFDGPPGQPGSHLISGIRPGERLHAGFVQPQKSSFGRGGMMTKFRFAQKAARLGITTWIANGKRPDVLSDILIKGVPVGTCFHAQAALKQRKRWLAHGDPARKGSVTINEGAEQALRERVSSLLPVGVLRVEGDFEKGDLVQIVGEKGEPVGLGKARFGAEAARKMIGQKGKKPLVHYDYLYLFGEK